MVVCTVLPCPVCVVLRTPGDEAGTPVGPTPDSAAPITITRIATTERSRKASEALATVNLARAFYFSFRPSSRMRAAPSRGPRLGPFQSVVPGLKPPRNLARAASVWLFSAFLSLAL